MAPAGKNPNRRGKRDDAVWNTQQRILLLMAIFGVLTFALVFVKLFWVQIINHDEYEERAINKQTMEHRISANRGTIYDSKGNIMAISATVYNVVVSPRDIVEKEIDPDLIVDGLSEILEIDPNEIMNRLTRTYSAYEVIAYRIEDDVAEKIRTYIKEMDEKKDENGKKHPISGGLYLMEDSKRYYPHSSSAAQVIGFVNSDNQGAYGLEAIYNDALAGENGRIITAKNGRGTEMLSGYEAYIDAQNGHDIHLTLDATIQGYAERIVQEGIKKYDVQNGAFCIVMNPKTGAIYAMVSDPGYDLNDHSTVSDPTVQNELKKMQSEIDALDGQIAAVEEEVVVQRIKPSKATDTPEDGQSSDDPDAETGDTAEPDEPEEVLITKPAFEAAGYDTADAYREVLEAKKAELEAEYKKIRNEALQKQWRNKAVTDAYEPGSTFKPVVVAMGLEEGAVTTSDSFSCTGSMMIDGWDKPIHCSSRRGHGTQNLTQVLMNSCNPGMMQITQRFGRDTFFDYLLAFGYGSKTGIDLQGEAAGYIWNRDAFSIIDLAVASFGQRFEVTPIQHITALSAAINGGHLMEPYVVQSVTDAEGNVVEYHNPKEVRQVVSEETSKIVREMMESVVKSGGGKNAYEPGYRIGGKTGTSEVKTIKDWNIVSFVGFAPVDDPQVIVLLGYDKPKAVGDTNTTAGGFYISGGNMAAPMVRDLLVDTLDYLGVVKASDQKPNVSVPNVTGMSAEEAKQTLANKGFSYRVVGTGDLVTDQTPTRGVAIPSESAVVLYMGVEKPTGKVSVPNVVGTSYTTAKAALEKKGLYIKASGFDNATNVKAFSQSVEAGAEVDRGTVVEVRFMDNAAILDR